jgi:hypothetical protein
VCVPRAAEPLCPVSSQPALGGEVSRFMCSAGRSGEPVVNSSTRRRPIGSPHGARYGPSVPNFFRGCQVRRLPGRAAIFSEAFRSSVPRSFVHVPTYVHTDGSSINYILKMIPYGRSSRDSLSMRLDLTGSHLSKKNPLHSSFSSLLKKHSAYLVAPFPHRGFRS